MPLCAFALIEQFATVAFIVVDDKELKASITAACRIRRNEPLCSQKRRWVVAVVMRGNTMGRMASVIQDKSIAVA